MFGEVLACQMSYLPCYELDRTLRGGYSVATSCAKTKPRKMAIFGYFKGSVLPCPNYDYTTLDRSVQIWNHRLRREIGPLDQQKRKKRSLWVSHFLAEKSNHRRSSKKAKTLFSLSSFGIRDCCSDLPTARFNLEIDVAKIATRFATVHNPMGVIPIVSEK